jgi:hypothetical protein
VEDRVARNQESYVVTIKKKVEVGMLATITPTATTTLVLTQRMKCESTPLGKTAAQGRFRIFAEGKIKTDYGLSLMTPKAGREIIKKFVARGNDMMIDLRHFSISPTATREQSEALGWIRCPSGLEYIDGDGLYAVGVQWDTEIKAGLECTPPKWKYFSPYYDQDKKTKVITELLNVALTNMPATHALNRLAAERRSAQMDLKMLGECMLMLTAAAEAGDEGAKAALEKLSGGLGESAQAALDAATAAPESVDAEDMYTGMGEDEKKMVASMPEEMRTTYMAGKKAMGAKVADEADKELVAESEKKDDAVAAESDKKDEKVSAGMSVDSLLMMALGAEVQTKGERERIVAEYASLIPSAMKSIVMDPAKVSDKVLAEFIAARKSEMKKTTVAASRTVIPSKTPETRAATADRLPNSIAASAEKAAKGFGLDPNAVLGELVAAQKAARS